jgi:hypothetical protein
LRSHRVGKIPRQRRRAGGPSEWAQAVSLSSLQGSVERGIPTASRPQKSSLTILPVIFPSRRAETGTRATRAKSRPGKRNCVLFFTFLPVSFSRFLPKMSVSYCTKRPHIGVSVKNAGLWAAKFSLFCPLRTGWNAGPPTR